MTEVIVKYDKPARVPPRCPARHPAHTRQVRCEEAKGHQGEHFNSFYMRSWSDSPA